MKTIKKTPSIETNSDDNFLYSRLISLLNEIKLVRGANEIGFTLRNHPFIRNYLVSKQISKINNIEENYFNEDGSLNSLAISSYNVKIKSLHNS